MKVKLPASGQCGKRETGSRKKIDNDMSSDFTVNKICEHGGKVFSAKTTVTCFCSSKCNSRNYEQKVRNQKQPVILATLRDINKFEISRVQLSLFLIHLDHV
jgi:hypothetical protein